MPQREQRQAESSALLCLHSPSTPHWGTVPDWGSLRREPVKRLADAARGMAVAARATQESVAYATPKAAEASPSPLQKGRGLGRGVARGRLSRGLGSKSLKVKALVDKPVGCRARKEERGAGSLSLKVPVAIGSLDQPSGAKVNLASDGLRCPSQVGNAVRPARSSSRSAFVTCKVIKDHSFTNGLTDLDMGTRCNQKWQTRLVKVLIKHVPAWPK